MEKSPKLPWLCQVPDGLVTRSIFTALGRRWPAVPRSLSWLPWRREAELGLQKPRSLSRLVAPFFLRQQNCVLEER